MALNESIINEILNHADIVKVISSFIPVIKKGKNYIAKCPFHDDTNPSMSISSEKKIFKCFVCGTGGSAIAFVQKYLRVSFFEAAKKVADISGYHNPLLDKKDSKPQKIDQRKNTLLACLKDLTLYYQYALNTKEGKVGLDYFENRKLTSELRDKYRLGYSFIDGKVTCAFLQAKGYSIKTLEDIGIASLVNGEYIDKNQGRIVFPIADSEGNVIGYSARRIKDNEEAKYVNSPETYLFHKSAVLYNYHIAKDKCRIANCIYVCEGFMDVFALARIGLDNAVALMGTALTQEHISMLRMLNVEVRLCLDGDLAGQTAMMKNAKLLLDSGIKVMIVDNQGSTKDPDEILNQDGPDALKAYLENTLSRVDFALAYYKRSNPLKTNEQKKKLINEFAPFLTNINNQLELDNYLHKLSDVTGYDLESIRDFVKRTRNAVRQQNPENVLLSFHPERKILRRLEMAEREFLYQMLSNKEAIDFYENKLSGFYDETYRQIANYLLDYLTKNDSLQPLDIISSIENSDLDNKVEIINEITTLFLENNHPQKCDEKLLNNLLDSITLEKDKIFEEDTLKRSLEGKSELEKARILADYNRRKFKKEKREDK